MGMYDDVDFTVKCPHCATLVTGFQTKDRDCTLELISPVGLDEFYSECDHCKTWLIYRWDVVHDAPLLDVKKMFFEQAFSHRMLRDQVFALCDKFEVTPGELSKLVHDRRKRMGR
ncbi:MAG: hypothetical protein OEN00_14775 [Gemmatimonadota bacterium]|nr:hypothetical protein [Gemmatimonadota bacterium]